LRHGFAARRIKVEQQRALPRWAAALYVDNIGIGSGEGYGLSALAIRYE
jgi:hypothetical protein